MSYAMANYGRSKLFRAPMARYGAMDARVVPQLKSSLTIAASGLAAGALMEYLRGMHGDKYYELGAAGQTVDAEIVVGLAALAGAIFLPSSGSKASKWLPPNVLEGVATGVLATSLGRAARRAGEQAKAKSAG
jgi:hypothetical protein